MKSYLKTLNRWCLYSVVVLMVLSCDNERDCGITIHDLRCEYRMNPLGIEAREPRLSWILESNERVEKQTAYHILVASSSERLDKNTGDLWDTGKVESDQSTHVAYNGKPLQSRIQCFWKVMVWNKDGEPSTWSQVKIWSMGLLNKEDFSAQWISTTPRKAVVGRSEEVPVARYLRHEFTLNKNRVKQARVYVSGLGYYELFINGSRIGDHLLDPATRNFYKQSPYISYEVTENIQAGGNALGIILGNGFFAGQSSWLRNYGAPMLLLQLEIDYDDGSRQTIVSDKNWKVTDNGPIRTNSPYHGETYDARMEMPNWNKVGFDDMEWEKVELVKPVSDRLVSAAGIPPIRVTGKRQPVKISQPEKDVWVFDMGQNLVGVGRLKVKGVAGTKIKMHFAESLYPNGMIDVRNLRSAACTDHYILKGTGNYETYTPAFTYHGFRFVEVTGMPEEPTKETLTALIMNTDLPHSGDFQCSDPTLTQIFKNAHWGIRGNYTAMPTDCPQRDERHGWLGDRGAEQKGESFLFDNITLYEKWMEDIRDEQSPDGNLASVAPINYGGAQGANLTWPGCCVLFPFNLYLQYGDSRAIAKQYDSIKRWMTFMSQYVKDGIIAQDQFGDWCSPPESKELIHTKQEWRKTPKEILATTYYYYILNLQARFAEILDKPEDKQTFLKEAAIIYKSFNDKLYDIKGGFYGNGSQTSQVLPLYFGLVPEKNHQIVVDYLANHIKNKTDGHIGTGLIGGQWLMRTLSDNGHIDIAYRIATHRDYPSWGYMIENGATTIWELWNGNSANPAMNSRNHVMLLGDLLIWKYEYLAGIKADQGNPGFKHIIMKPNLVDGLKWVNAYYNSVRGMIISNWKIQDNKFVWELEVPCNASATVYIPASKDLNVLESGIPTTEAEGVTFLRNEKGSSVFTVEAGRYHFTSNI
jgi:alpha-L-rhamnosidase